MATSKTLRRHRIEPASSRWNKQWIWTRKGVPTLRAYVVYLQHIGERMYHQGTVRKIMIALAERWEILISLRSVDSYKRFQI